MKIWAAIPVKPIAEGKSRLAGALSPHVRERLNAMLFSQTLDAVAAIFPAENIIVVSRDAALRTLATARGMNAIAEQGDALNAALCEAAAFVGQDALLAISTDLPEIKPAEVRAMLTQAEKPGRAVAIAPDRAQRGTNALFTAPAGCIPFSFGEESFAAHLAAAKDAGIEPTIIKRPGLAFDLDLPEDLPLCPPGWF
jgi:2-phospho-L-lactate guanylyltransferase